jgi:Na+-transporting NADH:ubiquinone oxidoreductase subunit NqrB
LGALVIIASLPIGQPDHAVPIKTLCHRISWYHRITFGLAYMGLPHVKISTANQGGWAAGFLTPITTRHWPRVRQFKPIDLNEEHCGEA